MKSLKICLFICCLLIAKTMMAQTISVDVTSPGNNTIFAAGNAIILTATASVTSGSITAVDFYQGATHLGTATLASGIYSFNWINVASGSYSVTARATTNTSATQNSSAVTVNVKDFIVQGGNGLAAPVVIGTTDSNKLSLATFGTTRVTVLQNGNVGIGTSTPGTQLNLSGTLRLDSLQNWGNCCNSVTLTTDSLGNVGFGYIPQYYFSQGIGADGNNVMLGGIFEGDMNLPFYNYPETTGAFGYNNLGQFSYDSYGGAFSFQTQYEGDTTESTNGLQTGLENTYIYNESSLNSVDDGWKSNLSSISMYSGFGEGGPGISLAVVDQDSYSSNNGIQIYKSGIDLNSPQVQLNYFPNEDGTNILTTDAEGNLLLVPFSNFEEGSGTYDDYALNFSSGEDPTAFGYPTFGLLQYTGYNGQWNMQTGYAYPDSVVVNSGLNLANGLSDISTSNQAYSDGSWDGGFTDIYSYSGTKTDPSGISLTVVDYSNGYTWNNGIQIYGTGTDLNTPQIQLNYFPNPDGDKILTTDSVGNLQLVPVTDFGGSAPLTFDNGLTQSGSEVSLGGSILNAGLDLSFYSGGEGSPLETSGDLYYNNEGASWTFSGMAAIDSAYGQSSFTTGGGATYNISFAENDAGGSASTGSANVVTYASSTMGESGISLAVEESGTDYYGAASIEIYSNGIDFNTPQIQFTNLYNTPTLDSVLIVDEDGTLKQKAISSFGLGTGHWILDGYITYDTLDNIAIGTSDAQGYKLAVNGDALFTKVKVKPFANWPDYVFDKKYQLPTIAELDEFIKKNNHLPDMPSAEEVQQSGLDVGANQGALLKKIEELTLYMIDLNKKVDALAKENEDLKKKLGNNH